ncbi:MAG: TolC family protein [Nitrospinae bacterium]|nr:TolC family protein [Nitrospinota bacterium]
MADRYFSPGLIFLLALVVAASAGAETGEIKKGSVLTLGQCVDVALEHQPAIISAAQAKVAAESRVGEAKSAYYPQLNATAGYLQTRPVPSATQNFQESSIGASLTQTIYDFGRTSSLVNAQKYSAEAAGSDVESAKNAVILGVKAAYYALVQSKRNAAVGKETVAQLGEHLELARGLFTAGEKPRYDVIKAEVDLSNAKIALIHALNNERLAKAGLDNAMGVTADYDVADDLEYKNYSVSLEEALKKAYENRPDYRAATQRAMMARETVEGSRSGYYPTLSGNAQYSTEQSLPDFWFFGVTLTVPIFTGNSTTYLVRESRANYNAAVSAQEQTRLNVYTEVSQAYLNLAEAQEKIPANELSVKLSQESLDISKGRYKEGVGTAIEVSDAQITFSNARVAYIQSLMDYKLAQATLEKAIGGTK